MSDLVEALEQLVREHRRIGSPMPDFLLPGFTRTTFADGLAILGSRRPRKWSRCSRGTTGATI